MQVNIYMLYKNCNLVCSWQQITYQPSYGGTPLKRVFLPFSVVWDRLTFLIRMKSGAGNLKLPKVTPPFISYGFIAWIAFPQHASTSPTSWILNVVSLNSFHFRRACFIICCLCGK